MAPWKKEWARLDEEKSEAASVWREEREVCLRMQSPRMSPGASSHPHLHSSSPLASLLLLPLVTSRFPPPPRHVRPQAMQAAHAAAEAAWAKEKASIQAECELRLEEMEKHLRRVKWASDTAAAIACRRVPSASCCC